MSSAVGLRPLMRRAYIGLGANQGDPVATLNAAITSLRSLERSSLVAASPMYVSAPVDAPGPDFVNAVVSIDTALEPYALLLHLLELELVFGRKRRGNDAKKNAPRSVDLDLLLVGGLIMRSTPLTLPHPRMHERAFVLRPLLDLVNDVAVPGRGNARRLIELTRDQRCEPLRAGGQAAAGTGSTVAAPATGGAPATGAPAPEGGAITSPDFRPDDPPDASDAPRPAA
jgi:2-amino-4-hydroxy-6-hydroxymethyldihydropteridine diphosphokinase